MAAGDRVKESISRIGTGLRTYASTRASQWGKFYEEQFAPWLEDELGAASTALVMFLVRAPFKGRLSRAKRPTTTTTTTTEGAGG
jgi:hypothetical protein